MGETFEEGGADLVEGTIVVGVCGDVVIAGRVSHFCVPICAILARVAVRVEGFARCRQRVEEFCTLGVRCYDCDSICVVEG